ncbi:Flp family type IVb pilin [Pseudaestuariivita sp.]|uniref:Flp family type IVb pilin n=1 Tax=Pseudaestuariivita sp. TaxID=2211669 RepID=UPI004058935B
MNLRQTTSSRALSAPGFFRDENGAVTVDWVVLTAAVVGLAIAAYGSMEKATRVLAQSTAETISGQNSGDPVPTEPPPSEPQHSGGDPIEPEPAPEPEPEPQPAQASPSEP